MTDTATPTVEHPEPPRDRYGRYLIPDPDTGEVMPYTRATTFAKSISDTFGLTKWMLRMGGIGLAQRQDLLLGIAAADPGDNKTLDRLMAEAKDHAGAMAGANIGTALHTFTELVDLGQSPVVPPPYDADVAAYVEAVSAAGLEIIPGYIEQVVVIPHLQVAGTLDRIVRTADGRLVIADLKTGKDVSYAMGEIAVQLALYASATHIFDPATGELWPMPEVDQERALVFHAPAAKGVCNILEVDIGSGRAMFEVIDTVRGWRKRRDLSVPYVPAAEATPPAAEVEAPAGQPAPEKYDWCAAAVTELVEAGHGEQLAASWPGGLPTLKDARERNFPMQELWLDMIHGTVQKVAAQVAHPFFACGAYPDDDAFVTGGDPRVQQLRERIEQLPADLANDLVARIAADGIPKLTSGKARRSHVDQVAAWVDDAETTAGERRVMAAAHLGVLPDNLQGAVMKLAGVREPAALTAQACERLGTLADAHELGALTIDGDTLTVNDEAFGRLLAACGGSKKALIDAAKQAATLCGLNRPSSSTQVANDPMLFAATYMATNQ